MQYISRDRVIVAGSRGQRVHCKLKPSERGRNRTALHTAISIRQRMERPRTSSFKASSIHFLLPSFLPNFSFNPSLLLPSTSAVQPQFIPPDAFQSTVSVMTPGTLKVKRIMVHRESRESSRTPPSKTAVFKRAEIAVFYIITVKKKKCSMPQTLLLIVCVGDMRLNPISWVRCWDLESDYIWHPANNPPVGETI